MSDIPSVSYFRAALSLMSLSSFSRPALRIVEHIGGEFRMLIRGRDMTFMDIGDNRLVLDKANLAEDSMLDSIVTDNSLLNLEENNRRIFHFIIIKNNFWVEGDYDIDISV
jgi:hypothetical protein